MNLNVPVCFLLANDTFCASRVHLHRLRLLDQQSLFSCSVYKSKKFLCLYTSCLLAELLYGCGFPSSVVLF